MPMSFELATLFGLGVGYLGLLFGIAFITDKGWVPQRIVRHPVVYVLSLGVFASVWAYYTTVGNALRDGYAYLAQYIGISMAFLLSPLLLRPILELTKTYQLSSLADLLAFRFRSPWAGTLTTLVILVGVTPLLALQIQAVADTIGILAPDASPVVLAMAFCTMITLFAILFGTSRRAGRQRHDGLVMAIAFESVVKLVALAGVGLFAVYGGFGGFNGMDQWLQSQPDLLRSLKESSYLSSFHVIALLFFTAAVAMPHMFYMTFNENPSPRALSHASWGLPLYFLLLSIPVLPILWAGLYSGSQIQVEYFPVIIGVEFQSPAITLLGFIGGLSAASGLIIVITLALSNMCLNHLILPLSQPGATEDIYRWLVWKRRILTVGLIWGGFLFYYLPNDRSSVQIIGTVGFTACLQFLPCIIALLYWPRANKNGFFAGLSVGITLWFVFLMLPITMESNPIPAGGLNWRELTILSLAGNIIAFVLVSLITRTSDEERSSADVCALDTIRRRKRTGLVAKSPEEFITSLAKPLGRRTATREVRQAMSELKLEDQEKRPHAMRMLRGRLEANLSGLLGPSIAHELIDNFLPYSVVSKHGSTDVNMIESRIEAYRSNLSGMAADLDNLRRYHRQILLDLPLGVCSLGHDNEVVMWNRALEKMTGIESEDVTGSHVSELPEPWLSLIYNFTTDDAFHIYKKYFELDGTKRSFNLHKAVIENTGQKLRQEGMIILLEDMTETEILEEGLTHSERLASIGRLAAGVAHEIGNPITGIACLAQNIRDETGNEDLRFMARQIIEQTDRTSRIVQSLVNFAHAGSSKAQTGHEVVIVGECMEEAKTLVSLDRKSKDINICIETSGDVRMLGDSQLLLQVLVNLISNARDASPAKSTITLAANTTTDRTVISITDEGIGIPAAIRDRIFEPFFTTKEAGEGTGLGLSLVFSIVEDLGGNIDIISPVNAVRGTGTRVILSFPCYDNPSSATDTQIQQSV
ncbi:MAG: ATP-binding protein [Pseudohongiellaceae bacterium]